MDLRSTSRSISIYVKRKSLLAKIVSLAVDDRSRGDAFRCALLSKIDRVRSSCCKMRNLPSLIVSILLLTVFIFSSAAAQRQSPPLSPCDNSYVRIDPPALDTERAVYWTDASINQPEKVDYIRVMLLDDDGVRVVDRAVEVRGVGSVHLEFPVDKLESGHQYGITATSVDYEGNVCVNEDGELTGNASFKYQIAQPDPVQVIVTGASIDPNSWELVINFDVNKEEAVLSYKAALNQEGVPMLSVPQTLVTRPQMFDRIIRAPIPLNNPIRKLEQPAEYLLNFCLFTNTNEPKCPEEPYKFAYTPPLPPTFGQKVGLFIRNSPYLLAAILAVISTLIIWFAFGSKEGAPNIWLVRAQNLATTPFRSQSPKRNGAKSPTVRLRAENSKNGRKTQKDLSLPCRIGRSDCHFNIPDDPYISQPHALLEWQGGRLLITDLESKNGTFIDNQQLQPHEPVTITNHAVLNLGPNTILKIDM